MVNFYKKILIAVDGSQLSKEVFRKGVELAKIFNVDVTLIGVVDTTNIVSFSSGIDESDVLMTEEELELLKGNEKMLKNFMDDLMSFEKGLRLIEEIRYGVPHREITAYAEEWKADLLVLGSHGKDGGLSAFLFGSTAKKLLKVAPCDVLVVKTNRVQDEGDGGKK